MKSQTSAPSERGHFLSQRRGFLQLGVFGSFGMALPTFLEARTVAGTKAAPKAKRALLIWLAGGPSHHDTWDPKPEASTEIRGEFGSIASTVPGIRLSESLPRLAGQMESLAVIRTLTHRQGAHDPGSAYMISGYAFRPGHNFASIGGVVSHRRQGPQKNGLPPFVALPDESIRGGGHLGASYNPLSIPGDPNAKNFRVQDLNLPPELTQDRFLRRRELSEQLGAEFRRTRQAEVQQAVDHYTKQAYSMVLSPRAQAAFDLTKETDKVREAYGRSTFGQRILLARRLLEADVPFVTVNDGGWDDHRGIFAGLRTRLPILDQAVAILIEDLNNRGLLESTLIVMMGEFGRTPKINETAGRDHWPNTFSVMLAGGGIRGGQVIGESDAEGGFPKDRPITPEELFHSLYILLGINPQKFLMATNGRETQIVREGKWIPELTR